MKFCLVILAGIIISTGLLFLFSKGTLTSTFQGSKLVIKNTSIAILPAVIYTNLITLGFITIASITVTLLISHKLAGPVYRFEEDLKLIGNGDLTKIIKIRGKDQLVELAENLNKMTASLHNKVLDIQTDLKDIVESASKQNAPVELIEGLNYLYQKIDMNFKI